MRLIDAKQFEDRYFIGKDEIANAPTVIAIPINWIHNYLDNTFLPESHFWVIRKMIKEWEEENEIG